MNILFMCVANSARSQMAEGLARRIFGNSAHIESAGSQPSKVNEFAVEAMREIGIDIKGHYSKFFDDLPASFRDSLDFVITLCAEEVCPTIPTKAAKLHWPMPDPAIESEDRALIKTRFTETRDALATKITKWRRYLASRPQL